MKISCEVIRDLLPLYHDDVCSAESKALVAEHLESCEPCRRELDLLNTELEIHRIEPNMEKALNAVSTAWKRVKKRSFVKGTVIAALICAMLIGAFTVLTQWKRIPASADVLEVTELCCLSDGIIVFHLFINDDNKYTLVKYDITDDGSLYITPLHSIIEKKREHDYDGAANRYLIFYPPEYDGEEIYVSSYPIDGITKIYVGPVGKGILVWEEGMELPAASEELEKKLAAY